MSFMQNLAKPIDLVSFAQLKKIFMVSLLTVEAYDVQSCLLDIKYVGVWEGRYMIKEPQEAASGCIWKSEYK